jgi:ATP-dependent Clp protease ATP-binding subunit ClpB
VDIQLKRLERMLADRKIRLEMTDRAKAFLADKGYDPVYGARPLKRTIQKLIQDPLALKILAGEIGEGDKVAVDSDGRELIFRRGGNAHAEETETVLH